MKKKMKIKFQVVKRQRRCYRKEMKMRTEISNADHIKKVLSSLRIENERARENS